MRPLQVIPVVSEGTGRCATRAGYNECNMAFATSMAYGTQIDIVSRDVAAISEFLTLTTVGISDLRSDWRDLWLTKARQCGNVLQTHTTSPTLFAVVVSGDGPNFCGHLILNVGGPEAPSFMSQGSEQNRSSWRSKDTAAI